MSWRNTFAALKHRNFRLFFIGQLVSLIGTWMQTTAQGWLVYQLTGSKVLLGTVAAVGTLPLLLLSLWGGSVADRHSKRTIVLYTQTGMMLTAFVFAILVGSGHIQTWQILLLAALGGVAMAFDMPARQAFMVEMTSREDLMNAVSLNSSIVNGARVVGPAVAGFLMASVGITWCFILNGVSFIAVIAGLLMMRLPQFVPPKEPHSTGRHILEGFKYVAGHRRVRILLLLFGVVGLFGWSYSVLLPAYATDILHVGERSYGVMLSANGFGGPGGRPHRGDLGQPGPAPGC
jgi:MFS family permease